MESEVLWDLPDHTVGKHEVLVAYLKAWIPILGQGFRRAVVVDGFAGPGEYQGGESGSPLLSWRVAGEHREAGRLGDVELDFRFFDADANAVEHLRPLLDRERKYDGMSFSVEHAICADALPAILADCHATGTPVFVMLDPKGLKGVSMDLISEIFSVPSGEVLFSFMHETAVRFGGTPQVDPYLRGLVGDDVPPGGSPYDYCDALEERFRSHGANYVLRFGLWQRGRHVYTLFFGTCNLRGCEVMKDAMWDVAGDGSYRFNGLHRYQPLLLDQSSAGNFVGLEKDLTVKFGYDRWVSIEELENFMKGDQTLFRKAHLRDKVLKPLQNQRKLEVHNQARRGQFPLWKDIRVRFLRHAPLPTVTQKRLV
jgi:hypothetical protein